jgi:hypothetical protein
VVKHFFRRAFDRLADGFDDALVGLVRYDHMEILDGNAALLAGAVEHIDHFAHSEFEDSYPFHFDDFATAHVWYIKHFGINASGGEDGTVQFDTDIARTLFAADQGGGGGIAEVVDQVGE